MCKVYPGHCCRILIFNQPKSLLMKPYYLLEEKKLRNNLELIKSIEKRTGVEFILAFKAFALWKTFPIFREYISHCTASSPYEARLAYEEFGNKAHTYSPAYESDTFKDILAYSKCITFNSLSQYELLKEQVEGYRDKISMGIRINPEYSEIETELYNPCAPGSRFGILAEQLEDGLPVGIVGFHSHNHCESNSYALERTLQHIEDKFGRWLDKIEWLNLGGGHLVSHEDYDIEHLVRTLNTFKLRHPELQIIMEPGSAFAWQTGDLVCNVVDIVHNHGIKTAILNVSFTCHMPDCLEMPYMPKVTNAETLQPNEIKPSMQAEDGIYRLGGSSCLSGDYMGFWRFPKELRVGDEIIFEDMIHYTTVKTNMFNGIDHPDIRLKRLDGNVEILKTFRYEDYRDRMD